MKRHAALLQHSREHHHSLKLARLASFAADSGSPEAIAQAAATILEECPETIEAHFRGEEEGILQQMEAIGQHELVARTLAEHARLRELCQHMRQPDAATLAGRECYLCGPPAMVGGLTAALRRRGVTARHLHFENFEFR